MKRRNKAFTLVELLVAVTLMLILSGSIFFIFNTAREITKDGEQAIFILQNVRNAVETMSRDLATTKRTHDMEFWKDQGTPPNGHFDPGESPVSGQFDFPGIPLSTKLKNYNASMTVVGGAYEDERHPERIEKLRCDALYFRGAIEMDKEIRECLIVYMLEVPDERLPDVNSLSPKSPAHPVLKRYTFFKDKTGLYKRNSEDLCSYVKSFKVEYYFDDLEDDYPMEWWGPEPGKAKEFVYRGLGELTKNGQFRVKSGDFNPPSAPPPTGAPADYFSQIGEGDPIYLYKENLKEWTPAHNKDYVVTSILREKNQFPLITFKASDPPPQPDDDKESRVQGIFFRAGYLPPAIRITLIIADETGKQTKTFKKTFRLKSR